MFTSSQVSGGFTVPVLASEDKEGGSTGTVLLLCILLLLVHPASLLLHPSHALFSLSLTLSHSLSCLSIIRCHSCFSLSHSFPVKSVPSHLNVEHHFPFFPLHISFNTPFLLSVKFVFTPSLLSFVLVWAFSLTFFSIIPLSPSLVPVLAGSCLTLHITPCLPLSSYPFFSLMCSGFCSPSPFLCVFLLFAAHLPRILKIKSHHKLVMSECCKFSVCTSRIKAKNRGKL